MSGDQSTWCRWGLYKSAVITSVRKGWYRVAFHESRQSYWRLACELMVPSYVPHHSQLLRLEAGATVLIPAAAKRSSLQQHPSVYAHVSFVRHIHQNGSVELRLPQPVATDTIVRPSSEVRLPLATGVALGDGPMLALDSSVIALSGEWRQAVLNRSSVSLGWHVTLPPRGARENPITAWVSGGQLSVRCDDVHAATAHMKPHANAESRLEESLRVLGPTGGFVRAVVTSSANGLFSVTTVGGKDLWVTASELVLATPPSKGAPPPRAGTLVAILPESTSQLGSATVATERWLPAARCVSEGLLKGTLLQRYTRLPGQVGLTVRLARKDGRFGLGHDEHNRIAAVHSGSAAEACGLQVGDTIRAVDGLPLDGKFLATQLQGREAVELEIMPSGSEADSEWLVGNNRILPILGTHSAADSLNVGDACYVLSGGWREAMVVQTNSDTGQHLVDFGRRARRWVSSGELAWFDSPPRVHEVVETEQLLAWHRQSGAFQRVQLVDEAHDDGFWRVRFEDGNEQALRRQMLRARWEAPLRVLTCCGDYQRATVVDSFPNGVLRLDFGGGVFRWVHSEELRGGAAHNRPSDGEHVYALQGRWIPGIVLEAAAQARAGVVVASRWSERHALTSSVRVSEVVALDGGDDRATSPIWTLSLGMLVVAYVEAASAWIDAAVVATFRDRQVIDVVLADGSELEVHGRLVRARAGPTHPLAEAAARAASRDERRRQRAAATVVRHLLSRRRGLRARVTPSAAMAEVVEAASVAAVSGLAHGIEAARNAREDAEAGELANSEAAREADRLFTLRTSAALTIQSRARARRAVRGRAAAMAAVVYVQSFSRRRCAMRLLDALREDREQQQREGAVILQALSRGRIARNATRDQLLRRRQAVLLLESVARAYPARRQWRRSRLAAVRLQAQARGRMGRKIAVTAHRRKEERALQQRRGAVKIQASSRAFLARSGTRDQLLRRRQATVLLQALARGFPARRLLRCSRTAIIQIQSYARGHAGRKVAAALANAARALAAAQEAELRVSAALTIQSNARAVKAVRGRAIAMAAIVHVQSSSRRRFAVRALCALRDDQTQRQRKGAVILQALSRGRIARNATRDQLLRRRQAVLLLESAARAYPARKQWRRSRLAAVRLQAQARGRMGRKIAATTPTTVQQATAAEEARAATHGEYLTRCKQLIREELQALRTKSFARWVQINKRQGYSAASARKVEEPKRTLKVRLTRIDGRFGMGHDEHNCIVAVHSGSAAEACGLQVGDTVEAVDGQPLDGSLLTAQLHGKEAVDLIILRVDQRSRLELSDLRRVAAELHEAIVLLRNGRPAYANVMRDEILGRGQPRTPEQIYAKCRCSMCQPTPLPRPRLSSRALPSGSSQ